MKNVIANEQRKEKEDEGRRGEGKLYRSTRTRTPGSGSVRRAAMWSQCIHGTALVLGLKISISDPGLNGKEDNFKVSTGTTSIAKRQALTQNTGGTITHSPCYRVVNPDYISGSRSEFSFPAKSRARSELKILILLIQNKIPVLPVAITEDISLFSGLLRVPVSQCSNA